MIGRRDSGTLGRALSARRRRAFVGRASELELFDAALASDDPSFAVLYVHGPGGIGKTSLLDELAERAAATGAVVARVDGRSIVPLAAALRSALADATSRAEAEVGAPSEDGQVVVLIDSYERLVALDAWVRGDLLPALAASAIVVLASREPPGPGWRGDPAWRDLLRIVSLRNLSPDECRDYLGRCGVGPAQVVEELVAASHGHPLGLSLLADLVLRAGHAALDPLAPDLVATLVRQFVEVVPSDRHRRALAACALSRATTEGLLRDAVDAEGPHELFEWLRGLSFVEPGRDGLVPHDLARDVLDLDLRWRDPDQYRDVFRRVRAHVHRRLHDLGGVEQQRAIFDEKFVFRNLPSVLSPVDWDQWGDGYPEPATASERAQVVALVRAHEGPAAATIAERWSQRQPDAFYVVHAEDGTVRGGLVLLTLRSPDDLAFDPGARAAWAHAEQTAPPRPGEVVTQTRFVVDRDRYQSPSPTLNAVPVLTLQRYQQTANLAWDYVTLADPGLFDAYFAIADLPRAAGADFEVDGRTYGLFAHDFRRVPVDAWLDLVTERALAQEVSGPPAPERGPLVLSQDEFGDAARRALRDLQRHDLLVRNPLQRSRLVRDRAGGDPPDGRALAEAVRDAADVLRADPRDDKRWRAVDRTYLRPSATQEQAAELLGLPFSTYRRHLGEGVARVVAGLWDRELYGTPPAEPGG
ncbi:MAG: AAA family ATPase [Acidimicrobiia bacterium]|nr:AAA family ATPase [Acidimicrobiia bacterium]